MASHRHLLGALLGSIIPLLQPAAGQAQAQSQSMLSPFDEMKRETNDIAVSIVVSGLSCTCARFAEDIRNVVNDLKPNGIRVLPTLGVGGLQNLKDVLFLKGVDMAVVDQDNINLLKQRDPKLYANLERRVQYIAKLYTAEFHVVARDNIRSYSDLNGKKVNFNLKDSQTEVTADRVFRMLNLSVERSYYDNDEAIQRLLKGEISAMIVLTGGPQAALAKLKKEDGVHFLPLDQASVPDRDVSPILAEYTTVNLTSKLYPNLIPDGGSVPTIANHALLAVYAWPERSERYQRLTRFVNEFFGKIDRFQDTARHPKWAEFNLATEIPGWTRFKPAANWIANHGEGEAVATDAPAPSAAAAEDKPADMRSAFAKVVASYQSANGNKGMTPGERELIKQFKQLLDKQQAQAARRNGQ
ncbi:MAG: TAXI family TRAP transporter solute-binding subunit [Xanthobacteraceae bacterium]